MSEKRTPYTTANKPRTPWPGETAAAGYEPPVGDFEASPPAVPLVEYQALWLDFDNLAALAKSILDTLKERDASWQQTTESTQRVGEIIEDSLRAENHALRQRLAALRPEYIEGLETAARAVVGSYEREEALLLLFREIEALGRVLKEDCEALMLGEEG